MGNRYSDQARNGTAVRLHVADAFVRSAKTFVNKRPWLRAWAIRALARFRAVKRRVKTFLPRTDAAAPTHAGRAHRHGDGSADRLPRRAARVMRDLDRERARHRALRIHDRP